MLQYYTLTERNTFTMLSNIIYKIHKKISIYFNFLLNTSFSNQTNNYKHL